MNSSNLSSRATKNNVSMDVQLIIVALSKIATAFEGVAALCSILSYKKYWNHPILKYFPIVLLYTFANEIAGQYFYTPYNNVLIYNILSLITACYFLWLFTKEYDNYKNERFIRTLIVVVILTFLSECIRSGIGTSNFNITYIVGGISIIIASILFLLEKLESSEILWIKYNLVFWISIGNLLFYVGYIPIKITRYYFASNTQDLYVLQGIHLILVIILYASYTLGCLWGKKKK